MELQVWDPQVGISLELFNCCWDGVAMAPTVALHFALVRAGRCWWKDDRDLGGGGVLGRVGSLGRVDSGFTL